MLTEVFSRKLPTMACLQEIIIKEDPSFSQEATLWEVKNTVLSGQVITTHCLVKFKAP